MENNYKRFFGRAKSTRREPAVNRTSSRFRRPKDLFVFASVTYVTAQGKTIPGVIDGPKRDPITRNKTYNVRMGLYGSG